MVRISSHWVPTNGLIHLVFDVVVLCLSVVLAVAWFDHGDSRSVVAVLPYALPFALGMMVLNTSLGVYRRDADRSMARISARLILCFVLAAPMAYGMSSLIPRPAAWRGELEPALALLLSLGITVAIRGYAGRSGSGPLPLRRVMVLGTGTEAALVEQTLAQSDPEMRIVGFYPLRAGDPMRVARDRVLADGVRLADATRRLKVDQIIVAVGERRADAVPLDQLLDCRAAGVRVLDLSSHFERVLGQVRLDCLHASWLIFGEGFRQGRGRVLGKRLFDVLAATVLLGLFSPLILLSAILIGLEGGLPIFHRQERVGQDGRLIRLVKFRSMRTEAEPDGEHEGESQPTDRDDVRMTRVGRALRRLRLDELPQLCNVLKGDLSLVGPRPERPCLVAQRLREIPFYAARHSVKPGITGWARVRGHYGESMEDAAQKLQYDLYYVKNHTLFLDIVILLETVGVALMRTQVH